MFTVSLFTFVLKFTEPPPAPTSLQSTVIAENAADGIKVYRFTWELPVNIDIKYLKFQLDNKSAITLMNTTTEIRAIPLSYGEHNVSIVIVDRCHKSSEATALQLDVMKGECIAQSTLDKL